MLVRTGNRRPLRVAFLNLQSGAHGEYGALLAAAVAEQEGIEVLSIVSSKLASSERAAASLSKGMVATVKVGGLFSKLAGLIAAWKHLRAFSPDIIHEPVGSGSALVMPLRLFLHRIAPMVVTEHNPEVHPGMVGWHHKISRWITRNRAAAIHVHGPKSYEDMRTMGVSSQRLILARHGAFDEYGPAATAFHRKGNKQILVFGALRPNKGIDMLPEVLQIVQKTHSSATLLVAGKRTQKVDGSLGRQMDIALGKIASMPGGHVRNEHIAESEIPRLFGECGVCLLPYYSATQSGVAMIAMSTHAPIVATAVGDIPDILEDGKTALFTSADPVAVAKRVIEVFDDPNAAHSRATAANRFSREECAWAVIGEKMVAAYLRLSQSEM